MASIEEILKTGQQRARKMRLSYAGSLLTTEAFQVWRGVNGAQLADVRTKAEFDWIGRIPGAVEIEFSFYPGNVRNPEFLAQIEGMVDKRAPAAFFDLERGR